ncbi:MAG: peptide chain release factor aRF-1 [Candidatus Aenigmatarchaeota archaeon]
MDEKEKIKLKKLVKELGAIKGRHTELVTVYIPAGFNLYDMVSTLRSEQNTASNIKSKTVRKNVVSALEKILGHLALYKKTPENGLAVFCGNVSEKEGVADIRLWSIEPPEPLRVKLYWCSQQFDLRPLEEMVAEKEIYGIICLDRSEADIALLVGKRIESLAHMESIVPGKSRAGGQSSARFARVREGLKEDWFKRIAEAANKIFTEHKEVLGILVSGSGPVKEEFLRAELLYADVKKKILGTVNTSYTGSFGLEETIERGADLLKEAAVIKEKNLLMRFLTEIQKPHGLAVYGLEKAVEALEAGQLEQLLLSEGARYKQVEFECGHKQWLAADAKANVCPACKAQKRVLYERAAEDVLEELAANFGTQLTLVSADTREGQQFLALGGIGGFLRYRA